MKGDKLLNLLNYFKKNNLIHNGLRSSIIGIDSDNSLKLLDYDDLDDLNTENDNVEETKEEINLYFPFEINNDKINPNYDIYSFGGLLIDYF